MMITLESANVIARKIGLEIRKASLSERKDALYQGVENPIWVIDSGVFKPKKAFGTVSEAFRYLCKREFEKLQETDLTKRQKETVSRAVYE